MSRVEHNTKEHFFYLIEDGKECRAEYSYKEGYDNVIDLYHTFVPEELGGRGYAKLLMESIAEYLKEKGLKIIPSCSYAAKFFSKPEFEQFIARV